MRNYMQKNIILIIFVLLFIITISGIVAAAGSNITNCITPCDVTNPIKSNDITHCTLAQNNCYNKCTFPSCMQFSCTIPQYTCDATTNPLDICTPNCFNPINCGCGPCPGNNDPDVVVPTPSTPPCDPNQPDNGQPPASGDPGNVTGEVKNNGRAADDEIKVNAATVTLQDTGLPIGFLLVAILTVFTGLLLKKK